MPVSISRISASRSWIRDSWNANSWGDSCVCNSCACRCDGVGLSGRSSLQHPVRGRRVGAALNLHSGVFFLHSVFHTFHNRPLAFRADLLRPLEGD